VYIGIGRPVAGGEVVSHVLGVPDDADRELITAGLEKAADGVELIIRQGFEPAMAFINRNDAPRSRP
jgi:peptidyl-tRNA hydrolase